jgi:hypothetical protein
MYSTLSMYVEVVTPVVAIMAKEIFHGKSSSEDLSDSQTR